ncbi:MAG: hypothetical protein Q4C12_02040 [Clostridia bacterium]|nr:hypothetical protein [Clostridia bacterium]
MNLEEQISKLLSDPETMAKIGSILGNLGGGETAGEEGASQKAAPTLPSLPSLPDDNRIRLLMALKPFLSEKRAPYTDSAAAILRALQLGKIGKDLKLF